MISVPVLCDSSIDILDISAKMRKGHGELTVSGPISLEVEHELQKAISVATQLSSFGEFRLPDLSTTDLHIDFKCRLTDLPISGNSYGLGLGVELLRLFSRRPGWPSFCFTGCLESSGDILPVNGVGQKIHGAIERGFERIYLPASQLDFSPRQIEQHPCCDIFDLWARLIYKEE